MTKKMILVVVMVLVFAVQAMAQISISAEIVSRKEMRIYTSNYTGEDLKVNIRAYESGGFVGSWNITVRSGRQTDHSWGNWVFKKQCSYELRAKATTSDGVVLTSSCYANWRE